MALSLRFAEEADFSSRAVGVDLQEEDERPLSEPIFRWSRSVRESLVSNATVNVEKLIVAMPGGPEKFLQELTSEWVTVATLVVSDETIQPCKLQSAAISACVVLSKYEVDDKANFGKVFAVRVPHVISQRASWVWVNALQKRIHARETFCLDSQTSTTIYDHAHSNEQYPLLRMLATSSVVLGSGADADKEGYPVRTLEIPRFTSGIPAALITLGEVKKQRVRVLLTICEFTTVVSEMVRCFLPLCSLLGLDRPLFFRPQGAEIAELDQEFNGLLCCETQQPRRAASSAAVPDVLIQEQRQSMTTPTASSGAAFSTRFLPSDGIPEYNALLDSHLGKRREYLLGNRKSLELLQQTGVISRVQAQQDNPNQYVVYMTEKPIRRRKCLPPRLVSSASSSNQGNGGALPSERPPPWRQSGHQHPSSSGLKKSETTPHLVPYQYRNERLGRLCDDDDESDRDEDDESEQDDVSTSMTFKHRSAGSETKPSATALIQKPSNSTTNLNPVNAGGGGGVGGSSVSSKFAMMKSLGRSLSTTALAKRNVGLGGKCDPSSSMDRVKTKKVSASERDPELFPRFSKDPEYDNHDRLRSESLAATTANQFRLRSKSVVAASTQGLPPQFESRGNGNEANQQNSQPQQHQQTKKAPLKGTVEHLLESDASYMVQIRVMKDQLADLDYEKGRLDAEVAQIRKRLRGVNAVHENDVAVAHCSSIMQHRLSKAEEEYMKLLTAQLQVRKDVDRVRREILSLKKVRKKLEVDIDDVRHMNALIEDKIRASKMTRNVVSAELVELEKKAELAIEEQRLNLPPEEAVVVDIEKLMSAVQERNSNRCSSRHASALWAVPGTPHVSASQLGSPGGGGGANRPPMDTSASSAKPRLAYQAAFQVIQNSLGCKDLTSFIESFIEIEEQLLSKYKATLALEEETVALQKDVQRLMKETASRHASIRGSYQASATLHDEMQSKIRTLLSKIDLYNDLRETRNQEHTRVRIIMQRCLEVLQAEKLLSGQESIGGPMLMSELPSPALLEALQKKITEVAMIMKMKHSAKIIEGPKNCFQAGRDADARRSNLFSTREVSKIVLGPREPAGSALAAILGLAQAPSVEAALALTEKNSMESNHTAICAADALAVNAKQSTKMSGGSSSKLGRGYEDIDNDAGPSSHPTIENTRRRSSRVSVAFPVGKKLDKLYDDEVITDADVEEDGT